MLNKFPFYKQLESMDCGPTCLRMIAKYYGRTISTYQIKNKVNLNKIGTSLYSLATAAETFGFRTVNCNIPFEKLQEVTLPCIIHWEEKHFVVVYAVKNKTVIIADPSHGIIALTHDFFCKKWKNNDEIGYCLILEATPFFYQETDNKSIGFKFFFDYFIPYKRYIIQIILGMFIASLLQLLFPFLTQSIVDFGINGRNLTFINLVLVSQLVLNVTRLSVDSIRNWIFLHVGTRISIAILSDYLTKIMKLPISFFEMRGIGDITQRIGDHKRVESFISNASLSTIFTFFNFIIFTFILIVYDVQIFGIFCIATIFYLGWILMFMKKRKEYDYILFDRNAANQNNIFELITGIRDIKLYNSEMDQRWKWEDMQAKLLKIRIKTTAFVQIQGIGSMLINETKNIIITIMAAKAVISGEITFGMMLSIQYILGQLNAPIGQVLSFISSYQDAKISLERLAEIHEIPNEDAEDDSKLHELPPDKTIRVINLNFKYDKSSTYNNIHQINLDIPAGKFTAIVGASGSGKTTLLKLLLKLYVYSEGKILIGGVSLDNISSKAWREACSSVLQDGTIFNETIEKNICLGAEKIDRLRLEAAISICNLTEVLEGLPLGIKTKIGSNGQGLSQGQKQRVLLARAAYRNSDILLLDEATNALDTKNEKTIMENLFSYFKGKTLLIAAHRLSTIKNADQIVVMDKGNIVEIGTHDELIEIKGYYYSLIENQMIMKTNSN